MYKIFSLKTVDKLFQWINLKEQEIFVKIQKHQIFSTDKTTSMSKMGVL